MKAAGYVLGTKGEIVGREVAVDRISGLECLGSDNGRNEKSCKYSEDGDEDDSGGGRESWRARSGRREP